MAKVLVVEDEDVTRLLLESRLRGAGHRVHAAASVAEAQDVVRRAGAPSLVLSDMFMPGGSGLSLVASLREDPACADLPVIFLSGRALPADIAAGQALGAAYLLKPFSMRVLTRAVDVALASSPHRLEEVVGRRLAELGDLADPSERALFADMFRSFVERAPAAASAVEAALARGDARELEAAAHRLRGAAATLGVEPLAALCARWESLAEQGELPDVEGATASLRGEVALTCRVLTAMARDLDAPVGDELYA